MILRYKEHVMVNEQREFYTDEVIGLKMTDEFCEANLKTKMIELGCSIDRRFIYYKFLVLETDKPERYPKNSEMTFPIEFDSQKFSFIINIPDERFFHSVAEKHYIAKVEVLN